MFAPNTRQTEPNMSVNICHRGVPNVVEHDMSSPLAAGGQFDLLSSEEPYWVELSNLIS